MVQEVGMTLSQVSTRGVKGSPVFLSAPSLSHEHLVESSWEGARKSVQTAVMFGPPQRSVILSHNWLYQNLLKFKLLPFYLILWHPAFPLVLCERSHSLCVLSLLGGTCHSLEFSSLGYLVTSALFY